MWLVREKAQKSLRVWPERYRQEKKKIYHHVNDYTRFPTFVMFNPSDQSESGIHVHSVLIIPGLVSAFIMYWVRGNDWTVHRWCLRHNLLWFMLFEENNQQQEQAVHYCIFLWEHVKGVLFLLHYTHSQLQSASYSRTTYFLSDCSYF